MTALFLVLFLLLIVVVGMPMTGAIFGVTWPFALLTGGAITPKEVIDGIVAGASSTVCITILLFLLVGTIMEKASLTDKIFNVFAYFFGKKKGFLPIIAILTCAFFGMISGSGIATTAAVGAMTLPLLIDTGYNKAFCAAILACAGCNGALIPPSNSLNTMAGITNLELVSLYKISAAGGFTYVAILIVIAYVFCVKHADDVDQNAVDAKVDILRERGIISVLKEGIWTLLLPVIVLGGIFSGILSAAEAAAVATIYAMFISVFIYKTVKPSEVFAVFRQGVNAAAPLMALYCGITLFGNALEALGFNVALAEFVQRSNVGLTGLTLLILAVMFLSGCVMDSGVAMLLLISMFYETLLAMGCEPYSFMVGYIFVQMTGMLTPPFGQCMFVACRLGKVKVGEIAPWLMVMCSIMLAIGVFIALCPGLFSWALPV